MFTADRRQDTALAAATCEARDRDHRLRLAVVIPCYRVKAHILSVLERIGPTVEQIVVVDDACPEQSGAFVREQVHDPRVVVLLHDVNRGVGGATMTGYRHALAAGADVIVKLDGDGQMDPARLDDLVEPIARVRADYTKGNRFHEVRYLEAMPWARLLGNGVLSFVNKLVSGYWHVMDPTNGFTAIHRDTLARLPLDKIEERYFFESDMLFRLALERAAVVDVPMPAEYGDERSNMQLLRVARQFPPKYAARLWKRLVYCYVVRDFNAGTVFGFAGLLLTLGGIAFGGYHWTRSYLNGETATAGTVMLAALPVLVGMHLLIAAWSVDIQNTPRACLPRRSPPHDPQ